jgi:hypothetical protein
LSNRRIKITNGWARGGGGPSRKGRQRRVQLKECSRAKWREQNRETTGIFYVPSPLMILPTKFKFKFNGKTTLYTIVVFSAKVLA